jgi:hypothetical protein
MRVSISQSYVGSLEGWIRGASYMIKSRVSVGSSLRADGARHAPRFANEGLDEVEADSLVGS